MRLNRSTGHRELGGHPGDYWGQYQETIDHHRLVTRGENHVAVHERATTDKARAAIAERLPALQRGVRTPHGRRLDLVEIRGAVAAADVQPVQKREYLTALRIHPGRDQVAFLDCRLVGCQARQSVERRHGHNGTPIDQRKPLNRRDPDPQASERSRSGRDGKQIDLRERHVVPPQNLFEFRRQPLAVGHSRIARRHVGAFVTEQGDASAWRRGIERENDHAGFLTRFGIGSYTEALITDDTQRARAPG